MAAGILKLADAGTGFSTLPIQRQIMILVIVSASIALGTYVGLWAKDPAVVPLYAHLDPKEAGEVMDALSKTGISYKFDATGGVMVPVDQVHEVRMQLASQGLPRGAGMGYELLDKPQGFGTSQFMESVRYRRSIEGELAKTIAGLDAVRAARVHLGLPRQSSFLKRNSVSSASVMLDLYGGNSLNAAQINGIVHLVSSSVAGLNEKDVTVIDQAGNMLSTKSGSKQMLAATEEANFIKQKEQDYVRKIHELLEPLFGPNGVSAEVTAFYDFTYTEKTSEKYDKVKPKVRSEVLITEKKTSDPIPEGVPGALSNQPPSLATAPEVAGGEGAAVDETGAPIVQPETPQPANFRDQATRNYEMDKSIIHEKMTIGKLEKLSVAVAVNHKITSYDAQGVPARVPLTEEEVALVDALVKDAVGFNEERGDKVRVVNTPFAAIPPPPEAPPSILNDPIQILNQSWFIPVVKQSLGGIFILLLVFSILKPLLRTLTDLKPKPVEPSPDEVKKPEPKQPELDLPPPDLLSSKRIEHVKQVAHSDTKKAAQVVMNWVGKEDD